MKKISGGLILYRIDHILNEINCLVAHPGGPFFKNKDDGWWSIPKGEPDTKEDIFLAALREFEEETGGKTQRALPRSRINYPKKGKKYSLGLLQETGRTARFLYVMR